MEGTEKYKGWPSSQAIYFTEGMVFAQTNEDKLISWKLLGNGKSEYNNAEKTQELLDKGLAEKVGLNIYSNDIYFVKIIPKNPQNIEFNKHTLPCILNFCFE